jgi:hypothetical protein
MASLAVSRDWWSYRSSLSRKSKASGLTRCWFSLWTKRSHRLRECLQGQKWGMRNGPQWQKAQNFILIIFFVATTLDDDKGVKFESSLLSLCDGATHRKKMNWQLMAMLQKRNLNPPTFCLVGLGFNLRASGSQSRHSTTSATPPVHFALVILEMGVSWTLCPDWSQILIFLILAYEVVSHQHPLPLPILRREFQVCSRIWMILCSKEGQVAELTSTSHTPVPNSCTFATCPAEVFAPVKSISSC